MNAPARRSLVYAVAGAVGTLLVIGTAVFLLKQGLDTSSKVAGVIGLFLSIAMAIWTVWQARLARREAATPDVSAPAPTAGAGSTSIRSGSTFGNVTNNNPGKVVMGDHTVSMDRIVYDSSGRAAKTEPGKPSSG
jgi:hypothetical protein